MNFRWSVALLVVFHSCFTEELCWEFLHLLPTGCPFYHTTSSLKEPKETLHCFAITNCINSVFTVQPHPSAPSALTMMLPTSAAECRWACSTALTVHPQLSSNISCLQVFGWLGSRVVSVLDSSIEGPGFISQSWRCRVTVLGKLFTPIVPLFTKQENW